MRVAVAAKRQWFPADIVLTEGLFVMMLFVPLPLVTLLLWRKARAIRYDNGARD